MKSIQQLLWCIGLLASVSVTAQEDDEIKFIPAWEAKDTVGTNVIAFAKAAGIQRTNATCDLLFNHRSRLALIASIPRERINEFVNLDALVGKVLEIKGTITTHGGRPFIVLTNKSQMRILEAECLQEETAIRVAALTYLFEYDTKYDKIYNYVEYVLETDLAQEQIVKTLAKYHVLSGPIPVEDHTIKYIDQNGKEAALWSIRVLSRSEETVTAQADCQQGMLKGVGWLVKLKKEKGTWKVIEALANRMS